MELYCIIVFLKSLTIKEKEIFAQWGKMNPRMMCIL